MSASANNARVADYPKSVDHLEQLVAYAALDRKQLSADSGSFILARNCVAAGARLESIN